MPNWKELLEEIRLDGSQSPFDRVRREHLGKLSKFTKRNAIVFYSGWLQKLEVAQRHPGAFSISDDDKNGLMACVNGLDRSKGLDLLLHTPGGEIAAVESIVDYLRSMFGQDIRAIVPQLAMSGGTLTALACHSIVMGKHSSLGPVDPQIGGVPAHSIITEFQQARGDIIANPKSAGAWQPILSKYRPGLINAAVNAITLTEQLVKKYLSDGMFKGRRNKAALIQTVWDELGQHAATLTHARHISMAQAKKLSLRLVPLEQDQELQDLVLTVHHACCHTFAGTGAVKVIENQLGTAHIRITKAS